MVTGGHRRKDPKLKPIGEAIEQKEKEFYADGKIMKKPPGKPKKHLTSVCPKCGTETTEDLEICPKCES